MNQEVKAEWLKALRSGEYQQGRSFLRRNDAFCCLGVLCDLAYKQGKGMWIDNPLNNREPKTFSTEQENVRTVLPYAIVDWAEVDSSSPGFDEASFADYNDGNEDLDIGQHSFTEIADLIEKHL